MPEQHSIPVLWTDRALQDAIDIKAYLSTQFSNKEFEHFMVLLRGFEIAVSAFPQLYPMSSVQPGIRRAVLSKVVSVFYRVHKQQIEVLAILDNRRNTSPETFGR